MNKVLYKRGLMERRRKGIRKKLSGTTERPRLCVRRSLKHIYAQIIDDTSGTTLAEASSVSLKRAGRSVPDAKEVGKALGARALENKVTQVAFDRAGRAYHGRLKALAEGAREAGLKF
jgi:large subunit ribosomal protein L18